MRDVVSCPCGSGEEYASCCEPLHRGTASARIAEQLVRARFSAFFFGELDFLVTTLHVARRRTLDRDTLRSTISRTEWKTLQILSTEKGGEDDVTGHVEFLAVYRDLDGAKRLHERSHFVKEDSEWYYASGEYENLTKIEEPGRNDPCWCSSGKKYKKCHGRPSRG